MYTSKNCPNDYNSYSRLIKIDTIKNSDEQRHHDTTKNYSNPSLFTIAVNADIRGSHIISSCELKMIRIVVVIFAYLQFSFHNYLIFLTEKHKVSILEVNLYSRVCILSDSAKHSFSDSMLSIVKVVMLGSPVRWTIKTHTNIVFTFYHPIFYGKKYNRPLWILIRSCSQWRLRNMKITSSDQHSSSHAMRDRFLRLRSIPNSVLHWYLCTIFRLSTYLLFYSRCSFYFLLCIYITIINCIWLIVKAYFTADYILSKNVRLQDTKNKVELSLQRMCSKIHLR